MNQDELTTKTFEILEATGLNWTVSKEPLYTQDGRPTETFGMFRGDTGGWLASVGNRYTPMQNATLAETMVQATDGLEMSVTHGGSMEDGKKVFLQAPLPDEYIGRSGVKRMITAINSHDGSTSVGFGSTSTVVICSNTFHKALKDAGVQRFRHTESAEQRLNEAMNSLRVAIMEEEQTMDKFKIMAIIDLKDEMAEGIIKRILKKGMSVKSDNPADLSTRKRNQLSALDGAISQELRDEGATLWGLFNGITRYTNHIAAPKDRKEAYLMGGEGARLNGIAFDEIMGWIEQNTGFGMLVEK